MGSLHDVGWRQGSLLRAPLPLDSVVARTEATHGRAGNARQLPSLLQRVLFAMIRFLAHLSNARVVPAQGGGIVRQQRTHDHWVVVTQDCDIARLAEDHPLPVVEIRPVYNKEPPSELGLRSRQLLLDSPYYIEAQSARTMISPAALTEAAANGSVINLPEDRCLALKTWLGLRYDRPAVPDDLVPLAKAIAEKVKQKKHRNLARKLRDILAQFEMGDPTHYSLYAVIVDNADRSEVTNWLSGLALSIPTSLGVADDIDAYTADETSLTLIESSYSIDAGDITWRGRSPDGLYPDGAY